MNSNDYKVHVHVYVYNVYKKIAVHVHVYVYKKIAEVRRTDKQTDKVTPI